MTDKIVIFSTSASEAEARAVARTLVERRLAACVAITPGLHSVYRWQGAIEESAEWGLTIKTRRDLFAPLAEALRSLHSYTVPELVAVPIVDGSADYLEWMDQELAPRLP